MRWNRNVLFWVIHICEWNTFRFPSSLQIDEHFSLVYTHVLSSSSLKPNQWWTANLCWEIFLIANYLLFIIFRKFSSLPSNLGRTQQVLFTCTKDPSAAVPFMHPMDHRRSFYKGAFERIANSHSYMCFSASSAQYITNTRYWGISLQGGTVLVILELNPCFHIESRRKEYRSFTSFTFHVLLFERTMKCLFFDFYKV